MAYVKVTWEDTNLLELGHRIYRGDTYFDEDEAPTLIAELGPDTTEYIDESVVGGQDYWYRVSAVFPDYEMKSEAGLYTVPPPSPGPTQFIGGDMSAGFFGETSTSDLISGDDLANAISLTGGTSHNSDEPWLKFALDGKVLFVAKKSYRHSLSWDDINAVNAVYGDRTVEIHGYTFKVRLLTGAEADPTSISSSTYDPSGSELSEWNRLMYNVHVDIPDSQVGPNWASYTNTDIALGSGDGHASWCQESSGGDRVHRGYDSLSYFYLLSASNGGPNRGWRPVLELVE